MSALKFRVLFVVFVFITWLSFTNILKIEEYTNTYSIRLENNIGLNEIEQIEKSILSETNTNTKPVFWNISENEIQIKTNIKFAFATIIDVKGEMQLISPFTLVIGSYPPQIQNNHISISLNLAKELFGTINCLGNTIYINDKELKVIGVFDCNEKIVFLNNYSQYYNIINIDKDISCNDVLQLFESLQIKNSYVLNSVFIYNMFLALTILPYMVYTIKLIIKKLFCLKKYKRYIGMMLTIAFILLIVLMFTQLLPSYMLPNKISDFNHYSFLIKEFKEQFNNFLLLDPNLIDINLKYCILNQSLLIFVSSCFVIKLTK